MAPRRTDPRALVRCLDACPSRTGVKAAPAERRLRAGVRSPAPARPGRYPRSALAGLCSTCPSAVRASGFWRGRLQWEGSPRVPARAQVAAVPTLGALGQRAQLGAISTPPRPESPDRPRRVCPRPLFPSVPPRRERASPLLADAVADRAGHADLRGLRASPVQKVRRALSCGDARCASHAPCRRPLAPSLRRVRVLAARARARLCQATAFLKRDHLVTAGHWIFARLVPNAAFCTPPFPPPTLSACGEGTCREARFPPLFASFTPCPDLP